MTDICGRIKIPDVSQRAELSQPFRLSTFCGMFTSPERATYFSPTCERWGFGMTAHDKTKKYIENQKEHHKKIAYNEEYLLFLKEYSIDYDDRYLWAD
ncbi:MAG: hypothetical protein Q4G08_08485 [Capnocytophaga sp.]|nr:hypothetical protein [Capnocytophaga sp.]